MRSACLRAPAPLARRGAGYEDWYVVEDFAALGVLNEAAVGRGHRTAHDARAPRRPGHRRIYRLLEGCAGSRADARVAVWIEKPRGVESPLLAALLGDGMDGAHAGLWQRQLALGPAPEYCLLAAEPPRGARRRACRGAGARRSRSASALSLGAPAPRLATLIRLRA